MTQFPTQRDLFQLLEASDMTRLAACVRGDLFLAELTGTHQGSVRALTFVACSSGDELACH